MKRYISLKHAEILLTLEVDGKTVWQTHVPCQNRNSHSSDDRGTENTGFNRTEIRPVENTTTIHRQGFHDVTRRIAQL